MALDLNKKVGPLSVRAWALVGAGTFGLVYFVTRRGGSGDVAEQDASPLEELSSGVSPYDDGNVIPVPVSVGSGGGGITDPYSYGGYSDPVPAIEGLEGSLASIYDLLGQSSEAELAALEGIQASLDATPAEVVNPPGPAPHSAAQLARLLERRQAIKARIAKAREADNRKAVQRLRAKRRTITRRIRRVRAQGPRPRARRPRGRR